MDPDRPADELRDEVTRLEAALEAERRHAEQWREVAEERRAQLEKLRQNPAIALLFRVARVVLPGLRRFASRGRRLQRRGRGLGRRVAAVRHQLDAGRRERRLRDAVAALPPAPPLARTVSVIVLTRDGRDRLETLLPVLVGHPAQDQVEVVVVDNGSGAATADWLRARDDVVLVRNDRNRSFSEANARGAAAASGEVLCFLNDDVEPVAPDWLARMVGHLGDGVVAAGAQLVYPRRPLLRASTRDLGVQHRGIGFEPVPGGVPQAENLGHGEDPVVRPGAVEVPASTAACLAVDRAAFEAVGGFDPRYDYGAEDVDLCWRLRRAGGQVVVVPGAVLLHHEGATRHREDPLLLERRQRRNWDLLAERFGPDLHRAVLVDRLAGGGALATTPFRVAITVTRDLAAAGYGDYHTAHDLGAALEELGWSVTYVERYRDAWYDLPADLDALIVLLDVFDVRRVARPGLTTIAWIRNWAERWASHPWIEDYDLVLASSGVIAEHLADATRQRPEVFPLATDPERFRPGSGPRSGIVFAGNYWGRDERITDLVDALPELEVYGRGWDELEAVAPRWKGQLSQDEVAATYAASLLVLDQAAQHTRADGSLNARVFDALVAGALPVTDQVVGATELFGDALPTYATPAELAETVARLRADPAATQRRAEDLRERVLAEHTYGARAERLRALLVDRARRPSFALGTSVPDRAVAETWGDWHLAHALAAELRARGHPTRVLTGDEWSARRHRSRDVFVHLKGRSRAPRAEGQLHVIWNISHPEELTPEECDDADLVLVASHTGFDRELSQRTTTPVAVLLQATDERRFRPRPPDERFAHPVAFVGNSRFTFRPVVRDALGAGLDVAVYGANWERYLDVARIGATHVPNEQIPVLYSSVGVLLNDHWDGMRRYGFASNRLYDALACGATVVSDELPGLDRLLDGAVMTYTTPAELGERVRRLLDDEDERRDRGRRGRAAVLAAHTFAHRADELLAHVTRHWDAGAGEEGQP